MPRRRLALVALTATLLASSPAPASPRDLTIQLSTAGLHFLDQEIPSAVPSTFSHPGFTQPLIDCPFTSTDTQLKVTAVQAKVKLASVLTSTESSGRIRVKVVAGVNGSLDAAANPCYLGDVKCRFDFSVSSASVTASFLPMVQGSRVELGSPIIDLQILEEALQVQASSCGMLSSLLNAVLPHLKGWLLKWVVDRVKQAVLESVPPALEDTLSGFTQMSGQLNGFSVSGKLEEAAARSDGVQLGIGITVTPTKLASCSLPKPAAPGLVTSSPAFSWQGEHLGLAAPRTTLEEALQAAWRAGFFCMNDAALTSLGLPATMKNLAGMFFGLTSTSSLELHAHQPPKLLLAASSDARLDLTLPGGEVRIKGEAGAGATEITARFDLKLALKLRLDPVSRAIVLELVSTSLGTPKLSASNDAGLKLDPTIFTTLIESTVLPLLESQVDGMQLMPQVLRKDGGLLDPYYLYLARGGSSKDHVSLYARVYRKPSSDSSAPSTSLDTKPAALLAPQVFRFVASGADSQTPAPLLRFAWRIDGASWSAAAYSRDRTLALSDGKHTVEVRAVDLSGNQDASPASVSFEVDGVKPTLQVTESPPATVSTKEAVVAFTASDDRTPAAQVAVKVRIEQRPTAGSDFSTLLEEPFAAGKERVTVSSLKGGTYRITLIARDAAGNLSDPASLTFQVAGTSISDLDEQESDHPGPADAPASASSPTPPEAGGAIEGGCSVSMSAVPDQPGWLLGGLVLLLLISRRRR